MIKEGFERKLTAILSADVAGYSRLMGEDEAATVRTLSAYREIMTTMIQQHRGRVVDSPGDNLLAEFASVVDAVQCGVAVQKELQARNAELSKNRRMEFRIGINLGDVIQDGDRIYGDGVNVAARLEALSDPGGICISKTAFDQIESKLPLGYEYLGDQNVKNIAKPVAAYRVLMEPRVTIVGAEEEEIAKPERRFRAVLIGGIVVFFIAIGLVIWNSYFRPSVKPASIEKMAFPLPDKPSIAILPFSNMSDDPKHISFADGISEDLTSQLSKISGLFVISRTSAFKYKGQAVDVRDVAQDLGVRYVLEGSVRWAENKIRVNAQLIDAITGGHLWAETYDDRFENVFALQDRINKNIITALKIRLTDEEKAIVTFRGTDNVQAYDAFLLGERVRLYSKARTYEEAESHYERAITLDPKFGAAYAGLGHVIWSRSQYIGVSRIKEMERVFELIEKAMALGGDPLTHTLLATIYLNNKLDHERAEHEARRAIEIDPNSTEGLVSLAEVLIYVDRSEEAIDLLKKAMRLNPGFPDQYRFLLGQAYFNLRRYKDALDEFSKFCKDVHVPPYSELCRFYQASIYGYMQEIQMGRTLIKTFIGLATFEGNGTDGVTRRAFARLPFKNDTSKEHFIEGIRKIWPK